MVYVFTFWILLSSQLLNMISAWLLSQNSIQKFKQISIKRKLEVVNNVFATSGMLSNNVGSWSQTFWDSLLVPSSYVKQWLFLDFLTLEGRTDRLSWNNGNQLQSSVITYQKSKGLKCMTAVAWNLVNFKYSSKENFWKIWSYKIKIECPNRP
jgi:hypothetical protein